MMKFGRNLPRNQVPEWAAEYVDYKGLKQLIKTTADQQKHGEDVDLAELFFNLDRNLERVDTFYNKKSADISRRLKLLFERHGLDDERTYGLDKEVVEDLLGALLEIRAQLRKLQWYGEVNRRAFIKITKKLDKKIPSARLQQRYLATKVEPKGFATSDALVVKVNSVNDWLSQLSDYKPPDDGSSTHSSSSLSNVRANATSKVPKVLLDKLDLAIRHDDQVQFAKLLEEAKPEDPDDHLSSKATLFNLLQRAISCRSKSCMDFLLLSLPDLGEEIDLNNRNCIHRLVIAIGRAKTSEAHRQDEISGQKLGLKNSMVPAEAPYLKIIPFESPELDSDNPIYNVEASIDTLQHLLSQLSSTQAAALSALDGYGRMPLHYAAQYGFVSICKIVIKCMQQWDLYDTSDGIDSPAWQDHDGSSPLHFAVMGGFPGTTKILLDSYRDTLKESDQSKDARILSEGNTLLALAAASDFIHIVRYLVDAGANVNHQDEHGEAPLHITARHGRVQCADALMNSPNHKIQVDIVETVFGWTPLHVACVEGQPEMVDLLIEHGADVQKCDLSGWTAKEHAALRGHMHIAERLGTVTPVQIADKLLALPLSHGPNPSQSERHVHGNGTDNVALKIPEPVKSFGHRYLTDESMVLVSLGSMDMRKPIDAVTLDNIPIAKAHATQLDTALSVVVSANGATGDSTIIDLPVQDSINTEPIAFMTKDISKVKIMFDIVPTYSGSKEQVVGRGVALLNSVKTNLGSKKMNLQGDISVPIVAAKTLDFIGSVHFNFLVITPFDHPNMSINETQTYWRSLTSPMVIGHRGLGKNTASRKSLQLGENTIQSFIAAANLGASYVEFDVQLTKDHVPVIYHDFLVSETGIDAPVHTLTLEQFLHVNESSPWQTPPPTPGIPIPNGGKSGNGDVPAHRGRALSLGHSPGLPSMIADAKMKHTRDFKTKGFKGNSRGTAVQAPFATLEEMFHKLPETVGFNIEMKYPMLSETEEEEMDTYAVELNSFVDTVLTKVYELGKKRDIIFSSFHPDICLLLSLKQPSIPVLFLTDAGTSPVSDVRASSLQEAIRFASRWNLLGIVTNSVPLVLCPRLVRVVKESGLVCVSYGMLNNEPKNVKIQVKEGLDAVIVDSVLAIRKGLTHAEPEKSADETEVPMVIGDITRDSLSEVVV